MSLERKQIDLSLPAASLQEKIHMWSDTLTSVPHTSQSRVPAAVRQKLKMLKRGYGVLSSLATDGPGRRQNFLQTNLVIKVKYLPLNPLTYPRKPLTST